ncbi:uncharacterized protein LOC129586513 [Paramacrobiotus metropolitanus]|uniref:uncharacterized protein LOC129586513 n=1 Tax=Paramacrobiotus metropolitanus TaxID=2943436 RepID=UPI002445F1B2|nr:uncharacterized protein LOC129586513 [Paramacrobiotus metropolitanus]
MQTVGLIVVCIMYGVIAGLPVPSGEVPCEDRPVNIETIHKKCVKPEKIAMWCPSPAVPIRPQSAHFLKTFTGVRYPHNRPNTNRREYLITVRHVHKNGQCVETADIERGNLTINGALIELKEANNGKYCCYDAADDDYGSCWNIMVTAESCHASDATRIFTSNTEATDSTPNASNTEVMEFTTAESTENLHSNEVRGETGQGIVPSLETITATTDAPHNETISTDCRWRATTLVVIGALSCIAGCIITVIFTLLHGEAIKAAFSRCSLKCQTEPRARKEVSSASPNNWEIQSVQGNEYTSSPEQHRQYPSGNDKRACVECNISPEEQTLLSKNKATADTIAFTLDNSTAVYAKVPAANDTTGQNDTD